MWPFRRRPDDQIDQLIRSKGVQSQRFVGHDEQKAQEAQIRRERAERERERARAIESGEEPISKLFVVGEIEKRRQA